jgi:hypothetical protein
VPAQPLELGLDVTPPPPAGDAHPERHREPDQRTITQESELIQVHAVSNLSDPAARRSIRGGSGC